MRKIQGIVVSIMVVVLLSACGSSTQPHSEQGKADKTSPSKKETEGLTDQEVSELLLKLANETPIDDNVEVSELNKLQTSTNGVIKQVGIAGNQVEVGYKNYSVPSDWKIYEAKTVKKNADLTWQFSSTSGLPYFLQMYMLPTYSGDIANLTGERLTEEDLPDMMENDYLIFNETGTTKIQDVEWHVGIEMGITDGFGRLSFYRMEEDKGSFDESVIVANLIFGVTPIVNEEQGATDSLAEQIGVLKRVLSTFGDTQKEIVEMD